MIPGIDSARTLRNASARNLAETRRLSGQWLKRVAHAAGPPVGIPLFELDFQRVGVGVQGRQGLLLVELDRYTACYENFVPVTSTEGTPYSGPRRAQRAKRTESTSQGFGTSWDIKGESPWLVRSGLERQPAREAGRPIDAVPRSGSARSAVSAVDSLRAFSVSLCPCGNRPGCKLKTTESLSPSHRRARDPRIRGGTSPRR